MTAGVVHDNLYTKQFFSDAIFENCKIKNEQTSVHIKN
jgi:hypothetical protein